MKRLATFAACLGVFPATLQAIDPPGPPTAAPRVMTPSTATAAPPILEHQPLPTTPTVPPIHVDDCGKLTGCPTFERSRTGLGGLLGPLRRNRDCGTECQGCGKVSEEKHCSSCASRLRPSPSARRGDDCGRTDRTCWNKFKDWLCWHPDYSKSIPCFRPTPYQAPIIAYFPGCKEPTIPAGGANGCAAKGRCGPAGCAAKGDCTDTGTSSAKGDCATGDCGPTSGRGTRLTGMLGSIRGRKVTTPHSAGADMSQEIAPGLRFANPTFSPPPPVTQQYAQPAAPKPAVTPANFTRPPSPRPPSSRPLTNP